MDTPLTRRSRRSRDRAKPTLTLSVRDVAIFQALHRYRYLRSTFLEALVGGEHTRFLNRLRTLFDAGYVQRPPRQWEFANAYYQPTIYELDQKGEEVLRERGLFVKDTRKTTTDAHHQFHHDLMVCDTVASIELGCLDEGLTFIPASKILARSNLARASFPVNGGKLVPDALFGIETKEGVILYVLEADRGTEQLELRENGGSSYEKKLNDYQELIRTGIYREILSVKAGLMVLHVTLSRERMQRMMKLAGAARYNLYKSLPVIEGFINTRAPMPELLSEPWEREGHPPFSIKG